jgi:hypothetical protein
VDGRAENRGTTDRITEVLAFVLALAGFAAIYALLGERVRARSGTRSPIQWRWLAAIAACAIAALIAGLVF